ncbi:MAG: Peptidyl-prolyl cis-trans isomerase PpiB [Candidatus Eremiobacteraeota bacterium]|nr:Peptidyl-prolyl cis-trans isomerase PpiB [Candidatus Eremiobacteraeota bacterium]
MNVTLATASGEIEIRLDTDRAPQTTANFLHYVRNRHYDGGCFFRTVTTSPDNQPNMTVRIDVIEAEPASKDTERPPVAFEPTSETGILHRDGTISMSRDAELASGRGNVFICVGDQPQLDDGGMPAIHGLFSRGFAAFGHVVRGMDVVRSIHESPRREQSLTPPVTIVRATAAEAGEAALLDGARTADASVIGR